jgi:hypothetical protein
MNTRLLLQVIISLLFFIAAFAHIFLPVVSIDLITVALLFVAVLPWLYPLFKSIELPWVGKFEFQDIEELKRKANQSGLLSEKNISRLKKPLFVHILKEDRNLALAGLRIELEKTLRTLAEKYEIKGNHQNVKEIIHLLTKKLILNSEEEAVLNDLIRFLNQATHGYEMDLVVAEWAMDLGLQILAALPKKTAEQKK